MYFGCISSYIDGGEAHMNPCGIPQRWEISMTWFDIWLRIFEMFPKSLSKM
jgi:hypothetical protein